MPAPASPLLTRGRVLVESFRGMIGAGDKRLSSPRALTASGTVACTPAIFEEAQIDRVVACGFRSTLEKELAKLRATSFTEAPLEEYRLGESVVAGGRIFTAEAVHFLGPRSPLAGMRAPLAHRETARLVNTQQGLKYFGHWLRDDCALYEYLWEQTDLMSIVRPDWPDRHLYESAFDQDWSEVDFAHVGDLTVYRELGFNRDKARRLRALRARLRAAHPDAREGAGKVVYISRGPAGAGRNMSNSDEFEEALARAGIRVVHPGTDPAALLRETLDARLIISIEGSQTAHGVYMLADDGAVLVVQPPDRFYNPHHEWARLLGMPYGIVVGRKDATGFTTDPSEVLRMADALISSRAGRDA